MAPVTSDTAARLASLMHNATADPQHAPGLALQVVGRHGETTYSGGAGRRGLGCAEPMTTDTVFWIASCTKLVSAVALMILAERGMADLDSADLLEELVPELKTVQILEDGKLRPKRNRITLRMLMIHTAGLSYSFYHNGLWRDHYHEDASRDEFQGDVSGIQQPLIFEPGTSHDYSVGVDWAGVFIARRTNTTLEEFFQANIFQPLGMASTSFSPSPAMRSRMALFHQRADGRLSAVPHFYRPAREARGDYFQSAGAGLMSTVTDYSRVLAMLLHDGLSPHTNKRVLAPETVDQMFTNQIPHYTAKYVDGSPHVVSRPDLCTPDDPAAGPAPVAETYGWGITMLLETGPGAAGTNVFAKGSATGLCNCFWSVDREKGVAAVCFSQVLPYGDPYVYPLWQAVEAVVQSSG